MLVMLHNGAYAKLRDDDLAPGDVRSTRKVAPRAEGGGFRDGPGAASHIAIVCRRCSGVTNSRARPALLSAKVCTKGQTASSSFASGSEGSTVFRDYPRRQNGINSADPRSRKEPAARSGTTNCWVGRTRNRRMQSPRRQRQRRARPPDQTRERLDTARKREC